MASPSYTPGNYPQQDSETGKRQFFSNQLGQISAAINQSASSITAINTTLSGLGTAATKNVGIAANNVVQLDGSARLPAVDGSQLTNMPVMTPPACGQLQWSSATQIKFVPFNGDRIKIAGTIYAVPSAGITAANTSVYVNGTAGQNLAVSTVYNVYLFNNSGTLTVDFSTTAHATDTTAGNVGVEIKSGDNTRTLIGKVRTNASSQFVDSATQRFVASWFNRKLKGLFGASTGGTATASGTPVELTAAARIEFVAWGDAVIVGLAGPAFSDTAGGNSLVWVGIDGTGQATGVNQAQNSANFWVSLGLGGATTPAEGYHYLTPVAESGGGTSTFYVQATAVILA